MYKIATPTGKLLDPPDGRCWGATEPEFKRLLADNRIYFPKDGDGRPRVKQFERKGLVPETLWLAREVGDTESSKKELMGIFPAKGDLGHAPKPTGLIERIIQIASDGDSTVLDSFAGSGTTAHAVLRANANDEGTRKFIVIESEDYADTLTAERVRRVIGGYAYVGTKRDELLKEKLNWTKLQKAESLLAKVEALKAKEGFTETPDLAPIAKERRRFDKINVKVENGELLVEGEKRISERVEGLGGEFTFCALGGPIDPESILSGRSLPDYESLGGWLFYTATGATLDKTRVNSGEFYLGEAENRHLWLVYKPDLAFLKSTDAALTLTLAKKLRAKYPNKGHLVFAAAKFLSNKQLLEHGVEFAPLPFAMYREA